MSVTRGEARRLQESGPSAAWWPAGQQPEWARVTPDDLQPVDLAGDDADVLDEPVLWRLAAFDDEREMATYDLCLATPAAASDSDGEPAVDAGSRSPSGLAGSDDAVPTFICRDAGAVVKFRDDITFATGEDAQPLARWFTWLQRRDALMAAEPNSPEWSGDDVEMQMARAGADVVAVGEQTALLSVFHSVAAMREWADRLTPRPLVPLEIHAFDAPAWFAAKRAAAGEDLFHQFHATSEDDPSQVDVSWIPMVVSTESAQAWYRALDGFSGSTCLWGFSEGGGVVSSSAVERAVPWGEVEPYLAEEFDPATPVAQRWVIVRMAGMLSGLPVPVKGAFVTWKTDSDGASFLFRAEEGRKSVPRARAEQEFRLKWARWYNTDEALSRDELARGLAAIEATMKEFS